MIAAIRKLIVQVDETRIEMGRPITPATRRAVAIAVIANPCAGRYSDSLDELTAIGEELGGLLGAKCVEALASGPIRRRATVRQRSSARPVSWSTPPPFCIPRWEHPCGGPSRKAPRSFPQRRKWGVWAPPLMCRSGTKMQRSSAATLML